MSRRFSLEASDKSSAPLPLSSRPDSQPQHRLHEKLHDVPLQQLPPLHPDSLVGQSSSASGRRASFVVSDISATARGSIDTTPPSHLETGRSAHSPYPTSSLSSGQHVLDPVDDSDAIATHWSPRPVGDRTTPNDIDDDGGGDNHPAMAASKKTPFLNSADGGPAGDRAPPYGSVSLDPSRDVSPAGSDSRFDSALQLRHVSEANRSESSRRSGLSKQASRKSEELDGAALVSGLDGRFGVTEQPLSSGVLDGDWQDEGDSLDLPSVSEDDLDAESEHRADDNSPHEAVRASVPPTDDTSLSINTPRMWFLSIVFSILGSSTNLFFSLRYPSVAITPVIALLLVHPLGLLWDFALQRHHDPTEEFVDGFRTPSLDDRHNHLAETPKSATWRQWLAQGRWNEKEHTCVYVSSNVAFGFAFATDVIVEQTQFYSQPAPILYQLLLTISTQILGYGFAGITRRFLVRPSGMIWPGTLMSAAMFSTLHKQDNRPANGWKITRWNFFFVVWIGSFIFYFLPGLLMPALSYFNVVTWFAPKNVVVANLFGVTSGLGLFPITFDWAQITYVGSPLLVPFWAAVNVMAGLAIIMWIAVPIFYYTNILYSSYMPILSTAVFDNTGNVYDVSKILTPDFLFDREAYQSYSRVFLPATYILSYGMQFAGLAALLTHTLCWHGKEIWETGKKSWDEARENEKPTYQPVPDSTTDVSSSSGTESEGLAGLSRSTSNVDGLLTREDVHNRLMRRYNDVPIAWYLLTFISMAAIGIFIVEYYPIHLPWYGLLLSLGIGAVFFIPNGIIMAVTNQHSSIYLICQLICGAVFPGRPIANMVFVTYGYISSAQGIKFAADLKLGHYMKIPPRILFSVQVIATLVSSVTQIGVLNWMFANVRGICTSEAVNGFTCPIARVHFNGSILWGVVGPGEFFGPGALYRALVWCFPLGAILPVPLWLYSRRRSRRGGSQRGGGVGSKIRKVNFPVIFGAMSWIPPATALNFGAWAMVCYVFNYLIKNRASAWWSKYTMTLSAALDSGLAFGIIVVFFGFIYPGFMEGFSWWGTEIYKQGCDWQACAFKEVSEGSRFGPDSW